jgi:hypothetical protein
MPCNRRHGFRGDKKLECHGVIEVSLAMPTTLREVDAKPHSTQAAAQPETDFAMMAVWLMICLINAVIVFGLS